MSKTATDFDIVFFDCDSTLSHIEGIDELAKQAGLGPEMVALTNQAMDGLVPLEQIYGQRLALIRPNRKAIDSLADLYMDQQVDGVAEVFTRLLEAGKQVHIISGGIRQSILPLAAKLGLPADNVHAVELIFDSQGQYLDFDQSSPLARSGGKAEVCRQLNHDKDSMVMIGDGQTDLESKQAGACFIGFGGVVVRPAVKAGADYYIETPSLQPLLDIIL
jgi:phosphoserine phosphatase